MRYFNGHKAGKHSSRADRHVEWMQNLRKSDAPLLPRLEIDEQEPPIYYEPLLGVCVKVHWVEPSQEENFNILPGQAA